ncbi:hypothetical protein GCM10017083_41100 [Thalassobaculum fulvum]|uniref:PAS domain-containing protein n=1 Tax=Thalassobaculum fulvum TaxID=1633335 RepID=A0A918XWH8_9PROT|nr:PAS domain-containing protein [Thalassobaculum fulvum]GHD58317.1 hypothetical protein GCM10017083_41100 [Thalassobaculum fulvum]
MDMPLDESQRDLVRLWHERKAGRRLPERSDFDLPDLQAAIGRVALLDVIRDVAGREPTVLRYRLFGTWIVHEIGQDLTGQTIDALLFDWQRDMVRRIYDRVVDLGRPVAATRLQIGRSRSMGHSLVCLPLGVDRVDMVMTVYALLPSTPPSWRGPWAATDSYELHQATYDLHPDGTPEPEPYARDAVLLEAEDVPPAVSPIPGQTGGPRCNVPVRPSRRL